MLNITTQKKIFIQFFILIILCYFTNNISISQVTSIPIKTLSANFERGEIEKKRISKTEGTICFASPNLLWIRVHYPISQYIKIDNDQMQIYYPNKKLLMNIKSETSISLSFLTPFIASLRSDYGLSDLNYQIKDYQIQSDTLRTEWHPPKELKKELGITKIETVSNRIKNVTIIAPSKKSKTQQFFFDDYIMINNTFWYPQSVKIVKGAPEDSIIDKIRMENISINAVLPDSITGFKIPDDVTIKEFKW
ncbi:MAG: hypothetical protein GF353_04215 [Candidatus Lokiarchaeota archaeon]|nr:hypothetical protein [Candidatus Lokiarchaeota archaeon]